MPSDEYKILSFDVKGQENHIMILLYMMDEKLHDIYYELKEPYFSLMRRVGIPETKEYRELVKIPILGRARGMSLRTAKHKINKIHNLENDKEFSKQIDDLMYFIENDPKYIEKVKNYVVEQKTKSNKYAKGYLGTLQKLDRYLTANKVERQLRNGFFQITGSEIFALSCLEFTRRMRMIHGISYDDVRILVPIYDEIVIIYKKEYEDITMKEMDNCFRPSIDGLMRFEGVMHTGDNYITK